MNDSLITRWWIFLKERFPLQTHLPMIFLFTGAHAALAGLVTGLQSLILGVVLLLFFFRMRLFDEIKDYAVDLKLHPDRPLPRGVLQVIQVKRAIVICLILEIFLVAMNVKLVPVLLVAQGYSLLMYKEFFIGRWLRPHLTTYAVTHTVVVVLLSLLASCFFQNLLPSELSIREVLLAISCWGVFNVFEFGRKTYATSEELLGVASYSKVWGHAGAFALNLSQALLGLWAMGYAFPFTQEMWLCGLGIVVALVLTGIFYLLSDTPVASRIYRGMSGLSIVLMLALGTLYAIY